MRRSAWRTRVLLIVTAVVALVTAVVPAGGPGGSGSTAAAAARTEGDGPLAEIRNVAALQPMCSGLTPDKLAAMAMTPTFSETGAPTTRAPSPMTLGRYDNQNALYPFATPGLADRAFFHAGIGMWQFDSAGGWNLTAAGAINTAVAATVALPLIRQRFCSASGTDEARRKYAWSPWFGCTNGTVPCESTFNSMLVNGVLTVDTEPVHAAGGMEFRTCVVQGIGSVLCGYVDPARAQGYKGFTTIPQGNGASPLTAPFYVFEAGGREYRYWLKADTGYDKTIEADKVVTANARTGLTWRYNDNLCDSTANRGACGGPPPPPPQPPTWSANVPFGGTTRGEPGVGLNQDGRQELFVIGTDGQLWHTWQTQPNGGWWSWVPLGGSYPLTARPAVTKNKDGRMEVFTRGTNGQLWHVYQAVPNGGWSSHSSLGGTLSDDPAVGTNVDGRVEVFARFTDSRVWHAWQVAPNQYFDSFATLNGVWAAKTRLAVAVNSDGRLELFGVATDNQIWHAWQVAPNQYFLPWSPLGGTWPQGRDVAAVRNQDGRLEVFALQGDGRLWHTFQVAPNAGWSLLYQQDANLWATPPAVVRDKSGRLVMAALRSNGSLAVASQLAPNQTWNDGQALGGSGGTQPVIGVNADGHIEAFYVGADFSINHAWQNYPPA